MQQKAERQERDRDTARDEGGVPTVRASEILGPSGLLRIELEGEVYTLRLTRNRRLILTK